MDEEETALDRLNRAVFEYFKEKVPEAYIFNWVLAVDTDRKDEDNPDFSVRAPEYTPYVQIVSSPDTRWSTSVGLLRIATKWKETH